jgi:drug/metabolite transporter (DMT)-like permease
LNYPAIKIANLGFSPVFNSFLRSVIASAFGIVYCIAIKEPLFHKDIRLFHGFIVGLLFGLEFVFIYWGMRYTDAVRAIILVNCSPFVVVLGAYLFLKEKLTFTKIAGLLLAFAGLYLVFQGKPRSWTPSMLFGDILERGLPCSGGPPRCTSRNIWRIESTLSTHFCISLSSPSQ